MSHTNSFDKYLKIEYKYFYAGICFWNIQKVGICFLILKARHEHSKVQVFRILVK